MSAETAPKVRAAIYARISRDAEGKGLGVERQIDDCERLAERLGWEVVARYVDNDISAYSGRVRPQYREMVQAIEHDEIDAVLAWHSDRLHRRLSELESFVTLVEQHSVQVQTVSSGEIDLTTATGRMIARILGATAQAEVEQTRARLRRQRKQAAEAGLHRGGPRPFGFEVDGTTHREDEAEVIRWATAAILAGRTLSAVARELNERGVKTSIGNTWNHMRIRDVLVRPRNAGLIGKGRASRGEVEIIGPAQWEPIISEDEWRALYQLLIDPSRRLQNGSELKHLGSGFYTCGICGGPLRTVPYGGTPARGGPRRRHYRCVQFPHLTVLKPPTDEYVRGVVAELIRDPRIAAALLPVDDSLTADRDRRDALHRRLEVFENDYSEGSSPEASSPRSQQP